MSKMRLAILCVAAMSAVAQDQTGAIEGVVLDAATHQPIKKATVSLNFVGMTRGANQNNAPQTTTTDFNGGFSFSALPAGDYRLIVTHQNYPQDRGGVHKSIRVSAGETASRLTLELVPGGAISGRIVDEDGDPLIGCFVQPHPAKNVNQGVPMMMRAPLAREDGTYRIYGIPPGKYLITAQCSNAVFHPRPLSEGPDPPPSAAYPVQFYPGVTDAKSAQTVELFPGTDKPGIDFQMRPVPVTHIHGTLTAGSADWHGRTNLQIQMASLDPSLAGQAFAGGSQINPQDGSFDIRRVFPGSYRLMVFSQDNPRPGEIPNSSDRLGSNIRVDVADKPVEISVPLNRAVDLSGTIEIEGGGSNTTNPLKLSQINVQLISQNQFRGPPTPARVNDDGTFTLKSVLPGEWRLMVMAPAAFLKSAWLGSDDVTGRALDLTSGSAAPLRILVSTNTASIKGTAPPGQMVFSARLDQTPFMQGVNAAQADSSGQFSFPGMAPGKYRLVVVEPGSPVPEEGGQAVTIREGETANVEIKP